MAQKDVPKFRKIIWKFYAEHKRAMPWRKTRNPYRILVSEIMLQQTQVATVLKKYPHFIRRFPTFQALARAPQNLILQEWRGLGYNRRAIALKKIAVTVCTKYNGKLLRAAEELDALPGIGHATASSIAAFAFNSPAIFIETNIRRVFIHHFFPNREKIKDSELIPFIEEVLDRKNPREWYFALMDYGAWLGKTEGNPNRRSAHYTKQSKFSGSRREVRGKILRLLLENKKLAPYRIAKTLSQKPRVLAPILKTLQTEGFIAEHLGGFSLT